AFVILGVFVFLPTLFNFVYAFTVWSRCKRNMGFVGLRNIDELLGNGSHLSSLRITLVYVILVAVFQHRLGLLLALLLERDTLINRFARVMFFIPVVMSALATGYVWQAMLKPDGAVNGMLGALLGQQISIPWLGSTTWTIVV